MTWFKVDDSFAFHPKAMAAGNAALGLWVRAGSWAAQQLTDGRIPSGLLQTLGGKPRDARRLVDVGLWLEVDGGWLFHDWDEFQPSRQVVQGKRADARERMKRVRAERRSREQPANVRENFAECSPYPDPTRPDPTQTPLLTLAGRLTEVGARELAAGLPTEVVEEWQRVAGPGVDLEDEARAYLARHGDTTPNDPRGAWLGWLSKARTRYEADYGPPKPTCTTGCADGWLPSDDDARPCPTCKPHLRPVQGVAL